MVVVLLVASLLAWGLLRSDDGYVAPVPETLRPEPAVSGAARTLDELADAVRAGDPQSAAALSPEGDMQARRLLTSLGTVARQAGVTDFAVRYLNEDSMVSADGGWYGQVRFRWRFEQFDPSPSTVAVRVKFEPQQDGRIAISGIGGGSGRSPLWLTDTVDVRRSDQVLVLATQKAGEHFQLASNAIPTVRKVLPEWDGNVVVEVPGSPAAMDRALGTDEGSYADVAAVAASVDGTSKPDSPLHIFVNPKVFDELDPVGAQVLMSHEATHVATEAALAEKPPAWLVEGFADYVALRDVDLPISTTAGQVIAEVREGDGWDELPSREDFVPSGDHLGATYEAAWLAARTLAHHAGEDALVRVYRRSLSGDELETALREETGLTVEELTEKWRVELERLAR